MPDQSHLSQLAEDCRERAAIMRERGDAVTASLLWLAALAIEPAPQTQTPPSCPGGE